MNKIILVVAICLLIEGYGQVCSGQKAKIESAGTDDGNFLNIWYPDATQIVNKSGGNDDMGLYLIVINGSTAQAPVLFKLATNGEGSAAENNRLKTVIEGLPTNTYVLVGIKGGSQLLDQVGMDALKLLGATQWPTLGKERVSFAMLGKKGATTSPQMFKMPKTGISVIEGCITTGALACKEGEYLNGTACAACDASCKTCTTKAKQCTVCNTGYQMQNALIGLCSSTGVQVISCPTGYIKMNAQCIAPSCIDEITLLNDVTGDCVEQLPPTVPLRQYVSTIKMNGFPMKQSCGYTVEVNLETVDKKYLPVTFEQKLADNTVQLILTNKFNDAKTNCPFVSAADTITYTCKYNATISMAKVPQTTIWLTQTLIVGTDTAATFKSVTITKNEMTACTGDKCTFQISVASAANQCVSFQDCSSPVTPKPFKRGEVITVRQQISEDSFKSYYLNPKSIVLKCANPETEITLKYQVAQNQKQGEIIYSIPLVVALGDNVQAELEVTSSVSVTRNSLLRFLQTTPKTENVVKTTQTINMSETGTTPKTTPEDKCDGLCEWEKILIGVLVGVGGAIILAVIAFFVYRKMKAGKQEQKYEVKQQVVEMQHQQ